MVTLHDRPTLGQHESAEVPPNLKLNNAELDIESHHRCADEAANHQPHSLLRCCVVLQGLDLGGLHLPVFMKV